MPFIRLVIYQATAYLMFGELPKAILPVDIILHVKRLVLLDVALVLEDEVASWTSAMEVGGLLPVEAAHGQPAVLGGAEPLEAVAEEREVLLVEVLVGEDIGSASVHLVAPVLWRDNDVWPLRYSWSEYVIDLLHLSKVLVLEVVTLSLRKSNSQLVY